MIRVLVIYVLFTGYLLSYVLPNTIKNQISQSGIPKKHLSIYIKEAGKNGKVVASLNEDILRTPASIVKSVTTYASLLQLGYNYRFHTKFYISGKVTKGVLDGNLYVKGFGDPAFGDNALKEVVNRIKKYGIKKINGNIVIDRSYFHVGSRNNSGFDKNTYSAYNAMPDAMMFNERVSTIYVTPKRHKVVQKYGDLSYDVVNKIKFVNKKCKGRYSWPRVKINTNSSTPVVHLSGSVSNYCSQRHISQVITKPYKTFYYALKNRLKSNGVKVSGYLKLNKVPSYAKHIFTNYSKKLEDIISKTAKKSNNLYARQLLLYLGAQVYGAPGTLDKGRKAISAILKRDGVSGVNNLQLDNGSGLSRSAKVTAKSLANMHDIAFDKHGKRWMKTLSIAGVDGTIKKRFRNTNIKNRAWMKTGTISKVKNIAGYVKNKAGKYYTVVVIVNSKRAKAYGARLQNKIIQWLRNTTAKPSSKKVVKSKPQTKSKVSAKYYIQVGAFGKKPSSSYFKNIKKHGLKYVLKKGKGYRVLVGPYSSKKLAKKDLKTARKYIQSDAFIRKR